MAMISDINKMQELIMKNRILANAIMGYCKHDIILTKEVKEIIPALEMVLKHQDEIEKLIENSLQK